MSWLKVYKNFLASSRARTMRKAFDQVYANPRKTPPQRFMWDHWHLQDQYRLHRTLAREFFPKKLYLELKNDLVSFGQKFLGCHSISEPWLSYYTEGDEQKLHTDSPHGPWAYVYSLTPWKNRKFSGGETFILRPETLNYWSHYSVGRGGHGRRRGLEQQDLTLMIPPEFNQLLVFDPRFPHGVRRVSGTHDPREGRLVIHGWFVQPEPFVTGSLQRIDITESLNQELGEVLTGLDIPADLAGILTYQLRVDPSGRVRSVYVLTNTVVGRDGEFLSPQQPLLKNLGAGLKKMRLPKARGKSEITLPLIFD